MSRGRRVHGPDGHGSRLHGRGVVVQERVGEVTLVEMHFKEEQGKTVARMRTKIRLN